MTDPANSTPGQPSDYGAPLPPPPTGGAPIPPPPGAHSAESTGAYPPPPAQGFPPPQQGFPPPQQGPGEPGIGAQFQNFDPKSLQNFDPKSVNPLDWGIIAAGVIAFIFSTFSFYKYSVSYSGFSSSGSVSAWHGFFGWFGVLVALLAALALALQLITKITLPVPLRTVVLGAFALGALCLLLALFVVPGNTGSTGAFGIKVDKGHGVGYWISFLAVLVGTGLSYLRFTATGGKLPSRA